VRACFMLARAQVESAVTKVCPWCRQGILKGEVSLYHWPPV
jgi:hypothetical protein